MLRIEILVGSSPQSVYNVEIDFEVSRVANCARNNCLI